MTGRLIHTGQLIMDLAMRVPALPEAGGDVLASHTTLLPGGGFNVMAAAARAGAPVVYAGSHGAGRFGDQARAALHAEGITVARPPTEHIDTAVCVVVVDDSGERTFITGADAESGLPEDLLTLAEPTPRDVLYLSGYSLLGETARADLLGWLPEVSESTVLFDPGPLIGDVPQDFLRSVLARVDVLSCSAREAQELAESADPATAATTLAHRIARGGTVLVRNGPAGCALARRGKKVQPISGFPVRPVDTTGAGDTHCGVLAAALLSGAELPEATRRANAAAALSVLQPGPATAPGADEVDSFLATHR